jgi:predicted nucleic acid-binding protein
MIVVADTSPLLYLILIEQVDLLRTFYGEVLIPDAVANELRAATLADALKPAVIILRLRERGACS